MSDANTPTCCAPRHNILITGACLLIHTHTAVMRRPNSEQSSFIAFTSPYNFHTTSDTKKTQPLRVRSRAHNCKSLAASGRLLSARAHLKQTYVHMYMQRVHAHTHTHIFSSSKTLLSCPNQKRKRTHQLRQKTFVLKAKRSMFARERALFRNLCCGSAALMFSLMHDFACVSVCGVCVVFCARVFCACACQVIYH